MASLLDGFGRILIDIIVLWKENRCVLFLERK
jgi:hypothetical protein